MEKLRQKQAKYLKKLKNLMRSDEGHQPRVGFGDEEFS